MKKYGLILLAGLLTAGCAAPSTVAEPTPPATSAAAVAKPSLPSLSSDQISTLQAKLRAIDPAATKGSFDKAQAVCLQIADGAHGEGFLRGVALRFDTEPANGKAIVDAIQAAGVCG